MKTQSAVLVLASCALAAPFAASAQGGTYIDGYGVVSSDATIEIDDGLLNASGKDDGDGGGIRAQLGLGGVYLTGEYQSVGYDDTDIDVDQTRLGLRFGPGAGDGTGLYAGAEYINYRFDYPDPINDEDEQSGFGGHLGFGIGLLPLVHAYGQVGYVKLDDLDGPEYLVGASVQVLPFLGVFADYRVTDFEDDNNNQLKFEDVRVGARLSF